MTLATRKNAQLFPFVAFSPLHRLCERRDKRHNFDMYSGTSYTRDDEEDEIMTDYVTVLQKTVTPCGHRRLAPSLACSCDPESSFIISQFSHCAYRVRISRHCCHINATTQKANQRCYLIFKSFQSRDRNLLTKRSLLMSDH